MKGGYSQALQRRVRAPTRQARLATHALIRTAEDVRATKAEWDTGTQSPAATFTTFEDGSVQLAATSTTKIDFTTSDGFLTDLDETYPKRCLAWELDPSIGNAVLLTRIQAYLSRKRDGGQPTYDGTFKARVYRIAEIIGAGWIPIEVCDPLLVLASSMSTDTELVSFSFNTATTPPAPVLDGTFIPHNTLPNERIEGRMVVVVIEAVGGTNTNYGWGQDSGGNITDVQASKGTLRHRQITAELNIGRTQWTVSSAVTGQFRCALHLGVFPAGTSTLTFSGGSKLDLGASVSGTVEFVVEGEAPAGTTLVVSAREPTPGSWFVVKDGQTPADVGLPARQDYDLKVEMTTNAGRDLTPTIRAAGIRDRTRVDVSEIATLDGFDESLDPLSGEVKMSAGTVRLAKTGVRDFRDPATLLASSYDFSAIEFQVFVMAPDVPRDQWLNLGIWRADDQLDTGNAIEYPVVGVLERLKGRFPRSSGTLTGYLLKAAVSDLTGGADFSRELSAGTETAGSIVVSLAASATEESYGWTHSTQPNITAWPPGSWVVKVDVTSGNANVVLKVRVSRVNAAGTVQQSTAYTAEQTLTTGTKVFSLPVVSWTPGAASNRVRVDYSFRNTVASTQAVTIATGTTNTEVVAPWTPTTTTQPKTYSAQTLQSVYEDWRDVQIGLAERYRGASPANTGDRLTKDVQDADGKRELERIAFCNGGTVIEHQGRVQYIDLYRQRAQVLVSFPRDEQVGRSYSPGLSARVPEYHVPWGYQQTNKEFAGEVRVQHVNALTKYGASRIDAPERRLEDATARWVPDPGLAIRLGVDVVAALGTGLMRWAFRSTVAYPELELGDAVAVETDEFTLRNPNTGEAIRGFVWGRGLVIRKGDLWGTDLEVWVRSFADLFVLGLTPQSRTVFEDPFVVLTEISVPAQPQNAVVRLQPHPETATVYVYYHAASENAPPRGDQRWTVHNPNNALTVARDASVDKVLSAYARVNERVSVVANLRIRPDTTPTIPTLILSESGSSPNITVLATATVDADARRIRWYRRDVNGSSASWPTVDGTQSAALDPQYVTRDSAVTINGGCTFADGTFGDGGLTEDGRTTRATAKVYTHTRTIAVIAVPVDVDGNVGPRKEASYTTANSASPSVTPITWAINQIGSGCTAGTKRKYDFAWTPASVVDGTHDLLVYVTLNGDRSLLFTEVSPNSVTSKTGQAIEAHETGTGSDPDITVDFDYELKAGSTIIASGVVTKSGGGSSQDFFDGQLCGA